jgi:hypothetical protein
MKFGISLLFLSLCGTAFSQNNIAAASYYQMIKNEQKNIGQEIYFYRQSVSELNLKILTFQIKKSIGVIDSTPAYNNETKFKNATVELFKYFLSVSQNQYKQLLQYVEDPNMDNKEYKAKLQALFKEISANEKPYDEKFYMAEDEYTKKYGIKLE